MTRKIHGRISFNGSSTHSDTIITIADNGWVHVEDTGRWHPPSAVHFIEESDEPVSST